MATRIRFAWLITFGVLASPTWADDGMDDVRAGRRVAFLVCYACHVVAPDQHDAPTLTPPAPSFESIAQRPNISAESLQRFLATTHRDASNPRAMPNPALIESYAPAAFGQALKLVRRKGTVVLVGLPPGEFATPIFDVVMNRITIRGSIVGGREDLAEAIALAAEGKVRARIHGSKLDHINQVFDDLKAGKVDGRVVLMM
jgi:Zinc-binding dehydrogenase